jgi:glycosyltransferase involved in cell wall biosynthesis
MALPHEDLRTQPGSQDGRPVLVIAMPFPPDGPVGASIRPASFCRHLPDFGWSPTVLSGPFVGPRHPETPTVPRLGATGRERAAGIHPPGWRDWFRPWLIPDRYLVWVPQAVRDGLAWLRQNPQAVLLSEGPSQATHLVAWWLKYYTGRAWLADFADPWVGNPFTPERPWPLAVLERRWERAVLQSADAIVTASPACVAHLSEVGGKPVRVVENGFEAGILGARASAQFEARSDLVLRHVGTLYGARTLGPLLSAKSRLPGDGRPCQLEQVGGDRLEDPRCQWRPAVPPAEAQSLISQSEVLVLIPGASYALPTKLYEYAASGRPILNLGDPDGEAARWIAEHGAGITVPIDDVGAIGRQLDRWRQLPQVPATGLDPEKLSAYDRRQLTGQLAKILDGVASKQTT